MTKKYMIALIVLLACILITVIPAGAADAIPGNGTVFRGEQGLDISTTGIITGETLGWFAAGSNPATDAPQATITVTNPNSFFVDPGMQLGVWYRIVPGRPGAFIVADPHLAITVWDMNGVDRTDGSVFRAEGFAGSQLKFRIISNLDVMANQRGFTNPANLTIRVGSPDGYVFTGLYNASGQLTHLSPGHPEDSARNQTSIRSNPWWVTQVAGQSLDVWDVSNAQYPRGTYTFWATCNVNSMSDNYNVVGKTKTTTHTIELIDEDTIITANKDTIIRGNDFSLAITGRPNTDYVLWVRGSAHETNITVPRIKGGQQGVKIAEEVAGRYTWISGTTVLQDVPGASAYENILPDGTGSFANVTLNSAGTRAIAFTTNQSTRDKTWTFRVQRIQAGFTTNDFDEVKVRVEKGAVTITGSGDGTYYLGQEVTLSGTNSDSAKTYLFITGPNLALNGAKLDEPVMASVTGEKGTFIERMVRSDDTWEYKWKTGESMLDPGSYMIYAVSQPNNKSALTNARYATLSVVIRKGFITATASDRTVAKGDKLIIHGTAEGGPDNIQIWLFGVNRYEMVQQHVEENATFKYEIAGTTTAGLSAGQYFIVAQHPMANGLFDVEETAFNVGHANEQRYVNIRGNAPAAAGEAPTQNYFIVVGAGRLQGSDAAEALTRLLDFQQIDDTYTKLTFLVEEPWIRLDTVGDKDIGETFTITGTTNLAIDNELIVEVISSSFQPTNKTSTGEFTGASAVVKVVRGDADYNTFSMDVDTSGFLPDEYIIKVESIRADATTTSTFNIIGTISPTPQPVNFTVTSPKGIPEGNIEPGIDLTIDTTVSNFISGSGTTFPGSDTLQLYTDLDSPRWNISIVLNGIDNPRPLSTSRAVRISGFELEYPSGTSGFDLQVRVSLQGTVPEGSTSANLTVLRIRQLDSSDNIRSGGEYVLIKQVGDSLPDPSTYMTLSPGWNFISIPKRLADGKNTAAIFNGVDTAGRSLFQYNSLTGLWETMTPHSSIRPLDTIWIYVNETAVIPIDYDSGAVQVPPSKQLYEGWNAVGFSGTVPATARDTLLSLSPKWTQVLGWNVETQAYDTAIVRDGSGAYTDIREMQPMKGYWIVMTEPGVLYALS